jgi:hypothetical protein
MRESDLWYMESKAILVYVYGLSTSLTLEQRTRARRPYVLHGRPCRSEQVRIPTLVTPLLYHDWLQLASTAELLAHGGNGHQWRF